MRFTLLTDSQNSKRVLKTSWEPSSPKDTQPTSTSIEEASTSLESSMLNTYSAKIRWVDAASSGGPGWVDLEEGMEFAKDEPPIMETIGHVIHEVTGPFGWVAMTDTLGGQECATVHKIPNAMILERTIL